jgi:beta-aspartyl-peptidase (threonine type)
MSRPALAIHGGAGTISPDRMTAERRANYECGLKQAMQAGWSVLESGGTSLEAVRAAVVELENFPAFNAGRGAVFAHDGTNQLDSSIMEGAGRKAGAVADVRGIRNPILLAHEVMINSPHVMLAGSGAEEFAKAQGIEFADPEYFRTEERYAQWKAAIKDDRIVLDHTGDENYGTVGAVACDLNGNIAAATSTGGMTNKKFGRVGDSPIIGAGTWADNATCAVSSTGHGEYFIRTVAAYDVHALMHYKGLSLRDAARMTIHKHLKELAAGEPDADGGLIAVDAQGNIALPFNSPGMYRAWRNADGEGLGIFIGETEEVE